MASANVPYPVQLSRPTKMSDADAGGEQARHEHDSDQRAAEPGRLHQKECSDERRAEQVLMAAKLPATPTQWRPSSARRA